MPFEKGQSGNPKGRPKGSGGYSVKLREEISKYCEDNLSYFLSEIKAMKTGHAKSQAFLTLLNFALPKLTENNSAPDMESLTDNQLDSLLNKYYND